MSMINVKREKIKNATHLVTDYMYEGDNVGINLNVLNTIKTNRNLKIPCIPISYNTLSFNSSTSEINITSNLAPGANDDITVTFNIKYPDKETIEQVIIDDTVFATDMINTCIVDKKDVKDIPCYKKAFDDMVDKIKEQALSENILIKVPELKMKAYVYTQDLTLLGTANRLMQNVVAGNSYVTKYILGEYCGKKLTEFIDEYGDTTKLIVDICVNDDIMLQLTNVELLASTDSTLGYAMIDASSANVTRTPNYNKTQYKIPEGFHLPEFKSGFDHNRYYEDFFISNSPTSIEKFYKLNKISTNPTIDINKYLIW